MDANERLQKLERLGERLVVCNYPGCKGNVRNQNIDKDKSGIVPRCLIWEDRDRPGRGCIVVGINPGHAEGPEQDAMRADASYKGVKTFWDKHIKIKSYYKWPSKVVRELGFDGPILWTELAKCETINKEMKVLPLQTFRNCMKQHLEEIELFSEYQIVTLGDLVFDAISYRFPNRSVIGIPHPKSYGQFHKLFENGKTSNPVKKEYKDMVNNIDPRSGLAIFIPPKINAAAKQPLSPAPSNL
jgi:hypothetical protein